MFLTETDRTTAVCEAIRTLHPRYIALVMATGIVSIGMHNHGVYALSVLLLWLGFGAFRFYNARIPKDNLVDNP